MDKLIKWLNSLINYNYFNIIVYSCVLIYGGCSDYVGVKVEVENHSDSYKIANINELVRAEYGKTPETAYKITPLEKRRIYIGGTLEEDHTLESHGRVWWVHQSSSDGSNIDVGADSYWDEDSKEYTAWAYFQPTSLLSGTGIPVDLHIGTFGNVSAFKTQFYVDVVQTRDYEISYSYQVGYDVFEKAVADDCGTKTYSAFDDAGTTFNSTEDQFTLLKETVPYNDPLEPGNGNGLKRYVLEKMCSNQLTNFYSKPFRMISVSNISSELASNIVGVTHTYNDNGITYLTGYSFVIHDRVNYLSAEENKKEITRIVIHELGHLRGQINDITNNPAHNSGHNGTNKSICVMLPGNHSTAAQTRATPVFCEGHKQILFNK